MKKLLFYIPLILSSSASAASRQDTLDTLKLPKSFLHHETLDLKKSCLNPEKIYYQVDDLGRFTVKNLKRRGDLIKVKYFPPTYQKEIIWKAVCGSKIFILKKVKYQHPAPLLSRHNVHWSGNGTAPFFMSNETVLDSAKRLHYFPVVWNKWGETVWAYLKTPIEKNSRADLTIIMMNEVSPGEWTFLNRKMTTEFLRITLTGKVLKKISFHNEQLPANSHEYIFRSESNQLIYYGFNCQPSPKPGWSESPTYLGSTLWQYDLTSGKSRQLWTTFDIFNPQTSRSLFSGPYGGVDRFLDADNDLKIESLLKERDEWYAWPQQKCHVDWSHENSIDYHPSRGYLISIRNLNKLVLWNPEKKSSLVIGTKPFCDLCLNENESFSMQHSAHFLNANQILLFDNNSPYRGYVGKRDKNRLMLLDLSGEPELKQVKISNTIELNGVQGLTRGSVSVLPNGHWLAYMPGNAGTAISFVEIDPVTKTEVYRLDSFPENSSRAIESKPFFSLNGDIFEPAAESPSEKAPTQNIMDQVMEFSY